MTIAKNISENHIKENWRIPKKITKRNWYDSHCPLCGFKPRGGCISTNKAMRNHLINVHKAREL